MYNWNELVSVIVPVYNGERTIERCVDSILAQTYLNVEVLVINDGSSDTTLDVCNKRYQNDSRVKILSLHCNKGVSAARNTGLENAGGAYIGFCDADDYLEPEMLEKLITVLVKEDAEIASCYMKDGKMHDAKKVYQGQDELIEELLCNEGFACNKLFNGKLLAHVRFDEMLFLCEDFHFLMQVYTKNRNIKMVRIPEELYNYSCGGITTGASSKHFKNGEFGYAAAFNKVADMAGDKWEQVIRHKLFMVAVAEKDSDYVQHVLSKSNREILSQVILENKKGFLWDSFIPLGSRLVFYMRNKMPWLKGICKYYRKDKH